MFNYFFLSSIFTFQLFYNISCETYSVLNGDLIHIYKKWWVVGSCDVLKEFVWGWGWVGVYEEEEEEKEEEEDWL